MVNIIEALEGYNAQVDFCDPWVDANEAKNEYGVSLRKPGDKDYDAIVVAVGHEDFWQLGASGIRKIGKRSAVLYDAKCVLAPESVDGRL